MTELFSYPTLGMRRKPSPWAMRSANKRFKTGMGASSCTSSGLGRLVLRQLGLVLFFKEFRKHVWHLRVLVHKTAVCFSHVDICAERWRGVAAVMAEERACNVARCGKGQGRLSARQSVQTMYDQAVL